MSQVLLAPPARTSPTLPVDAGSVPRPRLRGRAVLGPAFVAAIAYVDPGNFATNFQAGGRFGYELLWVVLLASCIAMPVQFLSAKLGIVTNRSLPDLYAERCRPAARIAMWLQAEAVIMATDLAEFVGAAIGLNLLFGVSMAAAAVITGGLTLGALALQQKGRRRFEIVIAAFLGFIVAGMAYDLAKLPPSAGNVARGLVPSLSGTSSILLAVAIVGATVMPHAIYLHSGITTRRIKADESAIAHVLRWEKFDIVIALGVAGVANMAMLAAAARLLRGGSFDSLQLVHQQMGHIAGGTTALAFAVALLASGISSSTVGTCSGDIVMAGFMKRRPPVWVRRLITMTPAIAILMLHADPTRVLVLSQVALSFGLPFALWPLLRLTSDRQLMGAHVNRRVTTVAMSAIFIALTGLNLTLVALAL